MTRSLRVFQVDAFTRKTFCGNPAGVVLGADIIDASEMQAIAREINCSETAFVLAADGDADIEIRYFTPTVEVPSCGHATIAAHFVLAHLSNRPRQLRRTKTKAGVLEVEVLSDAGDVTVCMTQSKPTFGCRIENRTLDSLLAALEIRGSDLLSNAPVQIVSTGHAKVIIPLKDSKSLDRLIPHSEALTVLSDKISCNGYFPFARLSESESIGRMFAPAIGIMEDPVTGNANGPLGAYAVKYGIFKHDGSLLRFRAQQGSHVGRPGAMDVAVDICDGEPRRVRIYGSAVIVLEGVLKLQ